MPADSVMNNGMKEKKNNSPFRGIVTREFGITIIQDTIFRGLMMVRYNMFRICV